MDYDPFAGDTTPVPSCWNMQHPEWKHFEGGAWYSRWIDDPRAERGQRLVLRVGAANYCARVFLDGRFLGRHLVGLTPFFVDLSAHMDGGRGHLMTHVENRRQPDRLADLVDIVGVNEYCGWYDSDPDDLGRLLARYDLGKPLVISETGSDVVAGREGSVGDLYSEAFGDDYLARQIVQVAASDAVKGFCPWLLYDFRTERRQNTDQRGYNRKGLIADDKTTRKRTFARLSAFYRSNRA